MEWSGLGMVPHLVVEREALCLLEGALFKLHNAQPIAQKYHFVPVLVHEDAATYVGQARLEQHLHADVSDMLWSSSLR